jgi:hypothetical protein
MIKTEILSFDKELAQLYLESNTGNRNISVSTVSRYADQMKRGLWKMTGETISIDSSGRLLNGQHRLSAVVKADVKVDMLVVHGVETDAQAFMDTGKNRSVGDVFSLNKVKNAHQLSSMTSQLMAMERGDISSGRNNNKLYNVTHQDVLKRFSENKEVLETALVIARKCCAKYNLITTHRLGAFIAYVHMHRGRSFSYIEGFMYQIHGINPSITKGTDTFREALIKDSLSGTKKLELSTKMIYLIKVWNAYTVKKDIKCLKYKKGDKVPEIA